MPLPEAALALIAVADAVRKRALTSPEGTRWLRDLPEVVRDLVDRWGITIGRAHTGGTASYVADVTTADGAEAVLKVAIGEGSEGHDAYRRAATTFDLAAGRGCARLLDRADDHDALLMERLGPNLVSLGCSEAQQLEAICATLQQFWRPIPVEVGLPTGAEKARWLAAAIEGWWTELDAPCAERTIEVALGYAEERAAAFDPQTAVLVHGDAHGWNTLATRDGGYRFVDPEGIVSQPANDLAVPMREMHDELLAGDPLALGIARAHRLSELTGVDVEAIWQWGSLERVSTALYSAVLGHDEWAQPSFAVADRWAQR